MVRLKRTIKLLQEKLQYACQPSHSASMLSPVFSLASGVLRAGCSALVSSTPPPSAYHVLVCPSTGSVAIAAGFALPSADSAGKSGVVKAKALWARLDAYMRAQGAKEKAKGGGSDTIAQGTTQDICTIDACCCTALPLPASHPICSLSLALFRLLLLNLFTFSQACFLSPTPSTPICRWWIALPLHSPTPRSHLSGLSFRL